MAEGRRPFTVYCLLLRTADPEGDERLRLVGAARRLDRDHVLASRDRSDRHVDFVALRRGRLQRQRREGHSLAAEQRRRHGGVGRGRAGHGKPDNDAVGAFELPSDGKLDEISMADFDRTNARSSSVRRFIQQMNRVRKQLGLTIPAPIKAQLRRFF